MSAARAGARRRWAASAAGAVVVMIAVLCLLRVPSGPPASLAVTTRPAPAGARPAVQLTQADGADQKLTDETVMHDQIPLFLPTPRNVALSAPRRPEAGRAMLDQDVSRIAFGAAELRLNLPAPEVVAEKPLEVMLQGAPAIPLHGFGQTESTLQAVKPHGGFVEVLAIGTNRRVLGPEMLGPEARPPTERSWRPMEFLARVNAAGLVGPLAITARSDVEEVDKFFRNYLGETFRIGDRLPPGSYRVIVGP